MVSADSGSSRADETGAENTEHHPRVTERAAEFGIPDPTRPIKLLLRDHTPIEVEKESPVFASVTELFRSPEDFCEAANQQSERAYPQYHSPFGVDDKESFTANAAGLCAVEAAANILCMLRTNKVTGAGFRSALQSIAHPDSLSQIEHFIIMNCFHSTWRGSQARDMDRYARPVNMHFGLLSAEEVQKDLDQAVVAASIIYDKTEESGVAPDTIQTSLPESTVTTNPEDPILHKLTDRLRQAHRHGRYVETRALDALLGTGEAGRDQPVPAINPVKNSGQVHACEAAMNIINVLRDEGNVSGHRGMYVLEDIITGRLSPQEQLIVRALSKATWRTGLPFEGPEAIAKDSNRTFAESEEHDLQYDDLEMHTAAARLLGEVARHVPEESASD